MKDGRSYPPRPTSPPPGRINGGIGCDANERRSPGATAGGATAPDRTAPDTTAAARAGRARSAIRGLYAITPDETDTAALVRGVGVTLGAGTRLLQYRNKRADAALRSAQLRALMPLCRQFECTLVVNDDWQAAIDLGIGAVHIGGEDGDAAAVRAALGPEVLLGISCYASLERARAVAPYADYLAFGSVFPSSTKPQAVSAALGLLGEARQLGKPVVAIGGIDAVNARRVIEAGADAVAVISAVFGAGDVAAATDGLRRAVALPD